MQVQVHEAFLDSPDQAGHQVSANKQPQSVPQGTKGSSS